MPLRADCGNLCSGSAFSWSFVTFATTYATFITMRSYEQIRLNVAYMGFNVKIIGTGSGLAMGMLGTSNYGIEDLAIMRSLPGDVAVGRGNVGGTLDGEPLGHRYAVALGLARADP